MAATALNGPLDGALGAQTPWPAPAKINRFLHITGRRADGYHELQSVFQMLEWGDDLYFELREDSRILRQGGLQNLSSEEDLVVRAARLLQRHGHTELGATIHLNKRIPVGAGLGGGSSNAATVLCVLNRLWRLHLGDTELSKLGLQLGADVPVFIHGHAAWAEGVGEQLRSIEIDEPWAVLIFPDVQINTAGIFAAPELPRAHRRLPFGQWSDASTVNVCEALVRARYPEVDAALKWLQQHGQARMSGTGSTVFSLQPTRAAASAILAQLPDGWRGQIARCCSVSPLQQQLLAQP